MASANFCKRAKKVRFALGTANANRDGTGTLVTMLSGGSDPIVADEIEFTFPATVTEGWIVIYADDGTNKTYVGEVYVPAFAPGLGRGMMKIPWPVPKAHQNLDASTDSLKASIKNAETVQGEIAYRTFTAA